MSEEFATQEQYQEQQTQTQSADKPKKDTVYLELHESFVAEGLKNSKTGEEFNLATLPKGTIVDGKDLGGYKFSPLFVNKPTKFENGQMMVDGEGHPMQNENSKWRVMPLLAENPVWLNKNIKDAEGNWVKDTVKVLPSLVKEALDESRKQYKAQQQTQEQAQEIAQAEPTLEEYKQEQAQQFEQPVADTIDPDAMMMDDYTPQQPAPVPTQQPAQAPQAQAQGERVKPKRVPPSEHIAQAAAKAAAHNANLGNPTQGQNLGAGAR